MKTSAKDNALLLLCAALCAGLAWAFWHFFGAHGFAVLIVVALFALGADNYRLRQQLRRTTESLASGSERRQ